MNFIKNGKVFIKKTKENGFSLIEILVSLLIFSVFIGSFFTGFNQQIYDSQSMKEEIILKNLCESKINEEIINQPTLDDSKTLSKETKSFEDKEYSDYQYTIEYKRVNLPIEIFINENSEDQENQGLEVQKKIFTIFKEHIKEQIWQLRVTVNKKSDKKNTYEYSLSTWILNKNPQKLNLEVIN